MFLKPPTKRPHEREFEPQVTARPRRRLSPADERRQRAALLALLLTLIAAALYCPTAKAAPAAGGGDETAGMNGKDANGRTSANASGGGQRSAEERRASGPLVSIRPIRLRHDPELHAVARLATVRGEPLLVDLGPVDDVRRNDLRHGQHIEAFGRLGRINQVPVLIATRMEVDGRNVKINRNEQQNRQQNKRQAVGRAPAGGDGGGVAASGTVKGRIVQTQGFRLRGAPDDQHILVTIETADGTRRLVHLGRSKGLHGFALEDGEFAAARGTEGWINGLPVLMARQFSDGEQIVDIQPPDRRRLAARTSRPVPTGTVLATGVITDTTNVTMKGDGEKHELVKIKSADGRTIVVDLGSEAAAGLIGFKKGDTLSVRGRIGKINDRRVIFADQVARLTEIPRPARSKPQSTANQQQQSGQGTAEQAASRNESAGPTTKPTTAPAPTTKPAASTAPAGAASKAK